MQSPAVSRCRSRLLRMATELVICDLEIQQGKGGGACTKKANQSSSAASGLEPDAELGWFVFVRRCLRTKMPWCGLAKCREIRGQPVTWEESRPTIRSSSKYCLKR